MRARSQRYVSTASLTTKISSGARLVTHNCMCTYAHHTQDTLRQIILILMEQYGKTQVQRRFHTHKTYAFHLMRMKNPTSTTEIDTKYLKHTIGEFQNVVQQQFRSRSFLLCLDIRSSHAATFREDTSDGANNVALFKILGSVNASLKVQKCSFTEIVAFCVHSHAGNSHVNALKNAYPLVL